MINIRVKWLAFSSKLLQTLVKYESSKQKNYVFSSLFFDSDKHTINADFTENVFSFSPVSRNKHDLRAGAGTQA